MVNNIHSEAYIAFPSASRLDIVYAFRADFLTQVYPHYLLDYLQVGCYYIFGMKVVKIVLQLPIVNFYRQLDYGKKKQPNRHSF